MSVGALLIIKHLSYPKHHKWGEGGGWSSVLSQKSNEICTRAYVKGLKELGDKIYQNSDSGNCYKLSEILKKGKRSKR